MRARLTSVFAAALAVTIPLTAPVVAQASDDPAPLPTPVSFEATSADMMTALAGLCTAIELRVIEEVEMPDATTQSQIDCTGFDYAGAPRLAEFVFADDALKLVWILVDAEELEGLTTAFTTHYGAPTHTTEFFSAYADDHAGVRYDTPEAAFYAASIADAMRGQFDMMVEQEMAAATAAD